MVRNQGLFVQTGIFATAKDVISALKVVSDVSGKSPKITQKSGDLNKTSLDRLSEWLNGEDVSEA